MVEDRVTDGTRVAQLLASELSGREDGALAAVTVVDADRDAEPAPEGTVAYGIAVRGDRVADVSLYPEAVEVTVTAPEAVDPAAVAGAARGPDLTARQDGVTLRVESGAAVKRAVDALVAGTE